jgi:hypothetical protein
MDIVVQENRLYIATHGWWASCWIAKPGNGGMVLVEGEDYSDKKAFNVDTYWVLSPEPGGLRVEDPPLEGPTRVYHLTRKSENPDLSVMWSDQPVHQSCLPSPPTHHQ